MDVRKRDRTKNTCSYSQYKNDGSENEQKDNSIILVNNKGHISLFYWSLLTIWLFILCNYGILLESSCELEGKGNEKQSGDLLIPFLNDSIARKHIDVISSFGRRPVGSAANEIRTPEYILNYVDKIVQQYSRKTGSNLLVAVDEHISKCNSFSLLVRGKSHFSSIYDGIRFIAIRIHDSRQMNIDSAIMINCHYDSFYGGPGASDDLVSCAVMLETLHSLLRHQPLTLRSDIILLLNGAEENIMQASHAFVTEHRWSKDVKFVINLEAAGSGGRQMIFQVSQQHPRIVNELGGVMKQTFATVIAQEIFSANLIPSDTDYRIFRDFGNIPGADLAFISNGYVYHTSYDTGDRIPQNCIRQTGENILGVALHLANINLTDSPVSKMPVYNSQNTVFFDFLGFVFVAYSEQTAFLLTVALLLLMTSFIFYHIRQGSSTYRKQLLLTLLSQSLWIVCNLFLSLMLGLLLHRFGSRMSWYSMRYNIFGLFAVPLLCHFFFYYTVVSKVLFHSSENEEAADCHRHSSAILISALILFLTVYRFLSCYLVVMWLIFFFINEVIRHFLRRLNYSEIGYNIIQLGVDTFSYSLPMIYYFYVSYTLYDVFIPIFGRSGPSYPDPIISTLTGSVFIIPGLLLSGNVQITKYSNKKGLMLLLLHMSISYYILIHSTEFGFPYNQSMEAPRKQRISINHVTRNFRNSIGEIIVSESGLWISSLDTNGMEFVKKDLQKVFGKLIKDVHCEMRPYCGYPMFYRSANIVENSIWIPQTDHKSTPETAQRLVNMETFLSGNINITMQISGPTHSPIYIMTPKSIKITGWSLGQDPPRPIDIQIAGHEQYQHYFIFYSYGVRPERPFTFWVTFLPELHKQKISENSDNQIEIALAGLYLLADTKEIDSVLKLMPKWTVPSAIASTYEHLVLDIGRSVNAQDNV